jgi:hypothetical protein
MGAEHPLDACMHMNFPGQALTGSETQRRYVAKPLPKLGVLVFFLREFGATRMDTFMGYLVPLAHWQDDVANTYLKNMVDMVHGVRDRDIERRQINRLPTFHANDILTLKCLINEAVENWSNTHG